MFFFNFLAMDMVILIISDLLDEKILKFELQFNYNFEFFLG